MIYKRNGNIRQYSNEILGSLGTWFVYACLSVILSIEAVVKNLVSQSRDILKPWLHPGNNFGSVVIQRVNLQNIFSWSFFWSLAAMNLNITVSRLFFLIKMVIITSWKNEVWDQVVTSSTEKAEMCVSAKLLHSGNRPSEELPQNNCILEYMYAQSLFERQNARHVSFKENQPV